MYCKLLNRRDYLVSFTAGIVGLGLSFPSNLFSDTKIIWDPDRSFLNTGKKLKIQPVLMYNIAKRKELSSWKSWGGIYTEKAAYEEVERISKELDSLSAVADFQLQILPVIKVKSIEESLRVRDKDFDVKIVYPATGSGNLLEACISGEKDVVIFVRHCSGPIYYWYEALSVRYLRTDEIESGQKSTLNPEGIHVHDVVVDDYQDLLWRLRALYGTKNFIGTRIVALGGAGGKYSPEAPEVARKKFNIEIIDVSYDDVEQRIKSARKNINLLTDAEKSVEKYLSIPGTTLSTEKKFVVNAFLLYSIFKDLMREYDAPAFTIMNCMSTIIPMSETTPCLSLSLLNDEGMLAFCESDFVIIPPGILLHYISGKPVFLHNSTFPHKGIVTCAHCTSPRRMDGKRYEPAEIMTHYESEYGAAPKVEIPVGQEVTFIDPEYSTGRWLGFKGIVESNPFYEICRSQQDVKIQGDWEKLIREVRDSHWIMAYGDYLKETKYAARKIGIEWVNISGT